jgi:hypothetical protein
MHPALLSSLTMSSQRMPCSVDVFQIEIDVTLCVGSPCELDMKAGMPRSELSSFSDSTWGYT